MDVSVIIAAYNAEKTIARTIESALAQTDVSFEVIVIDDCSSDSTLDVARRYEDRCENVRVVRAPQNAGPSAARNLGIDIAHGEWIAVLDADDTISSSRLSHIVEYGVVNGADIVFDNMIVVEGDTEEPFITKSLPEKFDLKFYVGNNLSYVSDPSIGYLKPLMRRAFLNEKSVRYDEALFNSEDYMMVLQSLVKGAAVYYTNVQGYYYYIYPSSISAKFKTAQNNAFIDAERNFLLQYDSVLSAPEMAAIKNHLYYRTISEHAFSAIEALKQADVVGLLRVLWPLPVRQKMTVLSILKKTVMKRLFKGSSRF